MVRTAGDCYQDETLCDGTVTADQSGIRGYWTGDPPGSDAGDVMLAEKDVVVAVGVAAPMPVEVAGVGVWLGVWVTLGVGE
jgi:hypothetical protein